jgi:CHRD domain-containing protein
MATTLRSRTALVFAAALLPTSVSATALAGPAVASTAAAAAAAPVTLYATLAPSGDSNGRGSATVRLNRQTRRVCATLDWSRIGRPNAAHIHRKSDGGIVVDLTNAVGDGSGCTTGVGRQIIRRIVEHPRRYYVNVHNQAYPAGAIQGTTHR